MTAAESFFQIPFGNFVRTNSGEMSENQIKMYRENFRSVGMSLLAVTVLLQVNMSWGLIQYVR